MFGHIAHVLDERSPLHGYDAARAIEADTQVFVTVEARDPTLTTTVHGSCGSSGRTFRSFRSFGHSCDIRNYAAEEIRFGVRYTDAMTTAQRTEHQFWT
jgi:inward rectifier potassium channel